MKESPSTSDLSTGTAVSTHCKLLVCNSPPSIQLVKMENNGSSIIEYLHEDFECPSHGSQEMNPDLFLRDIHTSIAKERL